MAKGKIKIPLEEVEIPKIPKIPKDEDNYMVVTIDYSLKLVFSYTDGMKFIDSLRKASEYVNKYELPDAIKPMKKSFDFKFISAEAYRESKMMYLLNIGKYNE